MAITAAAAAAAAAAAWPLMQLLLLLPATVAGCTQDGPLGMISGGIQDWQITASTSVPPEWDIYCEPKFARLYYPNGVSWCPRYKGTSEWLQVDLGVQATVTGIITQGRCNGKEWVTSFMMATSQDAKEWQYVMDLYANQRMFEGNSDSCSTKHNYLETTITTRFIRVYPVTYKQHPSMRIELVGCQPCKQLLAPPPYNRMAASTSRGRRSMRTCAPVYGHVMTDKGWCAKINDRSQWLQLDLGPPVLVTAVVTRGRGDGKRGAWVTAYRLAYSNDGNIFTFYKDAAHLSPKDSWTFHITDRGTIFRGNYNRNTERIHFLNRPLVTRFLRFHPESFHKRVSMRAGAYGCPHTGACGDGFFRVNNHTRCQANLAFGRNAWVNGAAGAAGGTKHRKRHLGGGGRGGGWHLGSAKKALDGHVGRHSCAVLKNSDVAVPSWFVDLRSRQMVEGVFVFTGFNDSSIASAHSREAANLNRLEVYVAKKPRHMQSRKKQLLCGYITNLNRALMQPRVHIPCSRPLKGRYVYIEARGSPSAWRSQFSASLCEVIVY